MTPNISLQRTRTRVRVCAGRRPPTRTSPRGVRSGTFSPLSSRTLEQHAI